MADPQTSHRAFPELQRIFGEDNVLIQQINGEDHYILHADIMKALDGARKEDFVETFMDKTKLGLNDCIIPEHPHYLIATPLHVLNTAADHGLFKEMDIDDFRVRIELDLHDPDTPTDEIIPNQKLMTETLEKMTGVQWVATSGADVAPTLVSSASVPNIESHQRLLSYILGHVGMPLAGNPLLRNEECTTCVREGNQITIDVRDVDIGKMEALDHEKVNIDAYKKLEQHQSSGLGIKSALQFLRPLSPGLRPR